MSKGSPTKDSLSVGDSVPSSPSKSISVSHNTFDDDDEDDATDSVRSTLEAFSVLGGPAGVSQYQDPRAIDHKSVVKVDETLLPVFQKAEEEGGSPRIHRPTSKPAMRVYVALKDDVEGKSSMRALNWILNDPLDLGPNGMKVSLIMVGKKKNLEYGEQVLKTVSTKLRAYGDRFQSSIHFLVEDRHGVGHTVKHFMKQQEAYPPELLVVGKGSNKAMSIYWHTFDSPCPVMLVNSKLPTPEPSAPVEGRQFYHTVALTACPQNQHVINAFEWVCKRIDLKAKGDSPPQMFVTYVVTSQEEETKKAGAAFIETFQPLAQGLPFEIRSAMICSNTIKGGIKALVTFKDSPSELLVVAPKPTEGKELGGFSKTRVGGSISAYCVQQFTCDILIFKDTRTRKLATLKQQYISQT